MESVQSAVVLEELWVISSGMGVLPNVERVMLNFSLLCQGLGVWVILNVEVEIH